ncbi:MAG TPA: SpoIID/LytB domain-containing protein [Planctomycetota bacterium]|nr:SpoIID/LytB domain-containing protein [Planctomycetota bacterium]
MLRVLMLESRGPVQVGGMLLSPGRGGLLAAGKPVGGVWRSQGDGPHPVGPLRVRGEVEVRRTDDGLRVVNRVGLEDYVAATLGREIYADWHIETQKAQAVLARTFALHRRAAGRAGFDLRADVSDQVYGGVGGETRIAREATLDTRGEVLLYGGQPILAAYHSSSGGRTASAAEVWGRPLPYLESHQVEGEEDSPDTYWRARFTGATLGRALDPLGLHLGRVTEVRVEERTASGRVQKVELLGTTGRKVLEGRALRDALGSKVVRSTLFEVRASDDLFTFVGSGHGHGVGMSQWGAEAMARRGADYREILAAFFPGTDLVRTSER